MKTPRDHPFGRLIRKHLRRGDRLNLSRLAEGLDVDPSVITRMCQGERLSNRDRVLDIIRWFYWQNVLTYEEEATALLEAANHARLNANQPDELHLSLLKRDTCPQESEPAPKPWSGVMDVCPGGLAVIEGYDLWFTSLAQGRWQIYRLDSQSGNISPIHFKMGRHTKSLDQFVPAVSPDGTKIAFAAGSRVGSASYNRNLYVANLDGTNVRQLTDSNLDVYHPSWSPDGKLLAYSAESYQDCGNQATKYGIWVMNLSSGTVCQLTDEGDYDPVWSPSGQYIAYHSMDASWSIKILDYETYGSAINSCLTWIAADTGDYTTSPGWINEYKIVFTSNKDGSWEIYELPVKPNHKYVNPIKLSTNQWDNLYPAVGNQKILLWQAFQHEEAGEEGSSTRKDAVIYVMNLDDREEIPLITGIGNSRDGFLSPASRRGVAVPLDSSMG